MQQVWPDSFVEEANLTVNISALRKALGETPEGAESCNVIRESGDGSAIPLFGVRLGTSLRRHFNATYGTRLNK
jgi:hypothetical protein